MIKRCIAVKELENRSLAVGRADSIQSRGYIAFLSRSEVSTFHIINRERRERREIGNLANRSRATARAEERRAFRKRTEEEGGREATSASRFPAQCSESNEIPFAGAKNHGKKTIRDIPGPFSLPIFGTSWIFSCFGRYRLNKAHEAFEGRNFVPRLLSSSPSPGPRLPPSYFSAGFVNRATVEGALRRSLRRFSEFAIQRRGERRRRWRRKYGSLRSPTCVCRPTSGY